MHGVFLDSLTIDQGDIDFSVLTSTLPNWQLYPKTQPDEVLARIVNADVVVTNKVRLNATHFKATPRLRWIFSAATGYDQIDIQQAAEYGITVCNVSAYSTNAVIQHTVGFILNFASQISRYANLCQQGAWFNAPLFCLQDFRTFDCAGKVLGILGYGHIGQGVAKVAEALGMTVLVGAMRGKSDPTRVPLKELFPAVDILSLHCPLTSETRHLINEQTLSMMKSGSFLINTARGGLIDEQALANALFNNHLGGAALDVLSQEPPDPHSPLFAHPLPNLIITPHVAWSTRESRQRLLAEVILNILAALKGEPRNVVVAA